MNMHGTTNIFIIHLVMIYRLLYYININCWILNKWGVILNTSHQHISTLDLNAILLTKVIVLIHYQMSITGIVIGLLVPFLKVWVNTPHKVCQH